MRLVGWLLMAAGAALLRHARSAKLLAGSAIGALGYTAVNSAGYDAEAPTVRTTSRASPP